MPFGSAVVVIESAVQETVRENALLVFTPSESVTLMVGVEVPIVVGVPEIRPPEASVMPAGRLPAVIVQV